MKSDNLLHKQGFVDSQMITIVTFKNGAKFNYRWIAYSAGVKYGTPEDWNFAWRMYNTTQVASERNLWLRALASSNDPYILQQ